MVPEKRGCASVCPTCRTISRQLESFGSRGRISSGEEDTRPHCYRRAPWDQLGRVAVLCDALVSGDGLDQAPQQHPAMRSVSAGTAVKAMGLKGLGFVHQPRDRVPPVFPHHPTFRRCASCLDPGLCRLPCGAGGWRRALPEGVTELSRPAPLPTPPLWSGPHAVSVLRFLQTSVGYWTRVCCTSIVTRRDRV
jgi:hypothetical protein